MVVIVRRGTLELARNGNRCSACDDQVVVIPADIPFDIAYRPKDDSEFVAEWLMPCPANGRYDASLEEMAMPQWLPHPIDVADPRFRQSLDRAMAAINQQQELPDVIAVHHMLEVFQWIELKGGCLYGTSDRSVSGRIRSICANTPSREWRPDEVADRMGLSVSCLRNCIRDEGMSFPQLLHDVRMSHALSLLLTTNMPVYAIAREIGYQSAPRFTIRFHERYGLRPGDVRGHDRPIQSSRFAPLTARKPAYAQQA